MTAEYELRQDQVRQRFFFELEQGQCYIDYRSPAHGVYDLAHTWTSANQRGQGLAGKLTEQVCQWMQDNHAQILPSCPFIADFLNRHAKYKSLVAE